MLPFSIEYWDYRKIKNYGKQAFILGGTHTKKLENPFPKLKSFLENSFWTHIKRRNRTFKNIFLYLFQFQDQLKYGENEKDAFRAYNFFLIFCKGRKFRKF